MVEPTTIIAAISAGIKIAKLMNQSSKSIDREPGKALRAGLRAFEDLRDNPND